MAEIGPTASYGEYVELGTSRMAPHAYLGPAFDRHAGSWADALDEVALASGTGPMTVVRLDDYYQAIAARLATTVGALDRDTFIGEPSPRMDSDGRAHPYAALYPSPGWQHGVSLGQGIDQAALTFQVTAAGGGDVARCLRAVDRVRDALTDFGPRSPVPAAGG